jgi:multidrug efflux pump subunit AcrB
VALALASPTATVKGFAAVLARFKSYLTPLVIMAPIPLTVIGVMPGHALLGAFFIVDDSIFNGLAVALIFGILVSTQLTLVVILVKTSDGWRVEENIHPAPRSSTPHRQRK